MDNNNNEDSKHRSSLPVTINLNPGETSQKGVLPATVTIPLGTSMIFSSRCAFFHVLVFMILDSHVNRVGDKISVNIDLRLVDLQNLQKQQQQQQNAEGPDWSSLDPLDRHIRKLERSIDQVSSLTNIFLFCCCYFTQYIEFRNYQKFTQKNPRLNVDGLIVVVSDGNSSSYR